MKTSFLRIISAAVLGLFVLTTTVCAQGGPATAGSGSGQVIQTQQVSDAPSDVVVSARSIATYTDSADDQMPRCVETKAAAEDVYAPNFVSDHGVRSSAVARGRSRVGDARIDGIAVLQAVKATAGLHSGIEVGS